MKTTSKKFHYVYRITNIVTEMHYYGDRSCNCPPSEDLGHKYFSSSTLKLFIQDQKNNPRDYKYKIIKIFETCREDAKQLEVDLHEKFDVKNHPKFINRANQTSTGFSTEGMQHDSITVDKIKNTMNNFTEEERLRINKKISATKANSIYNYEFYKNKRLKEIEEQSSTIIGGLTQLQIIGRKSAETRRTNIDEDTGLSLQELLNLKQSKLKKGKPNLKNKGIKSGSAKMIKVVDDKNNVVFISNGNLAENCLKYNILVNHLRKSYNNNGSIIKYSFTKRNKYINVNGWRAEIVC